nr:hypothetical protein [Tanacetum cinerariifolium]
MNELPCSTQYLRLTDSLLEEFTDELALLDPFPPGNKDDNFDPEADLREIKYLLNRDPSTNFSPATDIDIIDRILEWFTDGPALLLDCNSSFHEELPLTSFTFGNKDKIFNPDILVHDSTHFVTNPVTQDKNFKKKTSSEASLILEERNIMSILSDRELPFHYELHGARTLLLFSSENEDKVFNPGILISKGVHSLTLGLSHRNYEAFKIVNVYPNILNESPMKIFPFFYFFLWKGHLLFRCPVSLFLSPMNKSIRGRVKLVTP